MAKSIDPYHKWLGISPREQPPTHYRLLGVERFESDPDVIEAAADQRMAHVRTYQTGENSAISQKILNELSAAKLCLLDKASKAAYDAQLQRQPVALAPSASAAPTEVIRTVEQESPRSPAISIRTATANRKSSNPTAIILGVLAAAVLCAAAAWRYFGSDAGRQKNVAAVSVEQQSNDALRASRSTGASVGRQPPRVANAPTTSDTAETSENDDGAIEAPVRAFPSEQQPLNKSESDPPADMAAGKRDDPPPNAVGAPPVPSPPEATPAASAPQPKERGAMNTASVPSARDEADNSPIAAKPELPRFRPAGAWLDALKPIDPLEHLVQGEWTRGRKDLQATAGSAGAMMEIPVEVEGSYDLQLQFTRTDGDGSLAIVFPAGAGCGQLWLNSAKGQAGLSLAKDAGPEHGDASVALVLSNNRRYAVELRVRVLDQDAAHVEALLDKKELFVWDGASSQLKAGQQPVPPAGVRFSLSSGPAATATFHAVRIRSMSAEAVPPSTTSLKPKGAVVKLRVAAKIDGRDQLQIDKTHARWVHETWDWPANVRFCGVPWSPKSAAEAPFNAHLKHALAKADFQSAQLSKISGRGEIRLERDEKGLRVLFDDDAAGVGADDYEAVVTLLRDK